MSYFTREQYVEYLSSDAWAEKRQQRMRIDNYICRGCGKPFTPDIPSACHHMNYYHFTSENIWTDLVSLCPSCHETVHRVLVRPTGIKPDGSYRLGWKDTLPSYIADDLISRGLM